MERMSLPAPRFCYAWVSMRDYPKRLLPDSATYYALHAVTDLYTRRTFLTVWKRETLEDRLRPYGGLAYGRTPQGAVVVSHAEWWEVFHKAPADPDDPPPISPTK